VVAEDRRRRCQLPVDVTSKGKAKVDDIPTSTGNGNVHLLFLLYCASLLFMFMTFMLLFSVCLWYLRYAVDYVFTLTMFVVSYSNLPFNIIVEADIGEGTGTSFITIANEGQSLYVYICVVHALGLCVLPV
jgi:hypothetical protein